MKKSELVNIIKEEVNKVLTELESDQTIVNPDTGKKIKVSSALTYPPDSNVYKMAKKLVSKDKPTSKIGNFLDKITPAFIYDKLKGNKLTDVTDDTYKKAKDILVKNGIKSKIGSIGVTKKGVINIETLDGEEYTYDTVKNKFTCLIIV